MRDEHPRASAFCVDHEAIPFGLSLTMPSQGLAARAISPAAEMDVKERADMIRAIRAGEHAELAFSARTYRQKAGRPNRKHVRFREERLGKIARSGKGMPFLLDHLQFMQRARMGTILASVATTSVDDSALDEGETGFQQTINAVKPEAVISVLDGTIDRFSIGWRGLGKIVCTAHGSPARVSCRCWPGDEVEIDGVKRIVEYEFQDAEQVEVSAVNVPAVLGTQIAEIQAALAAEIETYNGRSHHIMSTLAKLAAHLGIAATASEDDILAAVRQREERTGAELDIARTRANNAEAALAPLQTQLAAARTEAAAASVETSIASAYTAGRLIRQTDAAGASLPDPFEASLRRLGAAAGVTALEAELAAIPVRAPIGLPAQGGPGQGKPSPLPSLQALDDRTIKVAGQLGLSAEDLHTYGPNGER